MTQRTDASRVDPVPAVEKAAKPLTSRSIPATPLTAPPAVPQPTPAALAALEALAIAAKQENGDDWYQDSLLDHVIVNHGDSAFIAACSPDVILALLAAARRGAGDTAILDRIEWSDDAVLMGHEDDAHYPDRKWSYRDIATPPTPEYPDGTMFGPTVRAVVSAAIAAAHPEEPQHGR